MEQVVLFLSKLIVIKHMVLMGKMVQRGIYIPILGNIIRLHFVRGLNHHIQQHITPTY